MADDRRYFTFEELDEVLGKTVRCIRAHSKPYDKRSIQAHTKGYDQMFVAVDTLGGVNFDFDEVNWIGPYEHVQVGIEWNGAGPIGYSKDEFDSFCEIVETE